MRLLLLDDGMICEAVAKVLYLDDDTIRAWLPAVSRGWDRGPGEFRYENV
jgi:hypothetical protein